MTFKYYWHLKDFFVIYYIAHIGVSMNAYEFMHTLFECIQFSTNSLLVLLGNGANVMWFTSSWIMETFYTFMLLLRL